MGKIAAWIMRLGRKVSTTKTVINRHPTPHHKRQIITTVTRLNLLREKLCFITTWALFLQFFLFVFFSTIKSKYLDKTALTTAIWKHRNPRWHRSVFLIVEN